MSHKCPTCGTQMKPLFTGMFCPKECDKKKEEQPKKKSIDELVDDLRFTVTIHYPVNSLTPVSYIVADTGVTIGVTYALSTQMLFDTEQEALAHIQAVRNFAAKQGIPAPHAEIAGLVGFDPTLLPQRTTPHGHVARVATPGLMGDVVYIRTVP